MAFAPTPDQIVIDVGGDALLRYGRLTRTLAPIARGGEEAKETHTRASKGTFVDRDGVGKSAGVDKPRPEWIKDSGGLYQPHLLLEAARTQLVTDPENFGAWSIEGTPILTAGQADPFGGTAAYLIEDNDGTVIERIVQNVAFTADATKAISVFLEAGTSGFSRFGIFDSTAATWRHQVNVTWMAGVPTLATNQGAGTLFPVENWGGGWYRLSAAVNGVVAANTNNFYLMPTLGNVGSETGTTFFFGANAWNATFPSSYQGPSLASRSADSFSLPFPYKPQQMWGYSDARERGLSKNSGSGWAIFAIPPTNASPDLNVDWTGSTWRIIHENGTSIVQGTVGTSPTFGARNELLWTLKSDGRVQLRQSIDGATDVVGTETAALALAAKWATTTLALMGFSGGLQDSMIAHRRFVVGLGTLPANIPEVRDFLATSLKVAA